MFRRTLSVAWFAVRGTYEDLMVLSGMGFLWFLMSVALPYGVFLLTARFMPWPALSIALTVLSLVLVPPSTAAIFDVAWHLAREKRIEFAYFWQGLREYFWPSWKLSGIMLVALGILLADAYFFFRGQGSFFAILGFIMLWALFFWIAIQVYLYPLLIALEEKRLGIMFRNAAQLVAAFPLFCLLILIVALVLTVLSVLLFLPLATFWMPLIALLFSRAFTAAWDEAVSIQQRHQQTEAQN
jgi:uncharacterized membrane protein YesL